MKRILLFVLTFSFLFSYAQTPSFVSTSPENKKVILEEYTGIHCSACPGGHSQSQTLYNANTGNIFVINIHTGSLAEPSPGEPDYRIDPTGNNLLWASVPGAGGVGFPGGTINRHEFGTTPAPQNGSGTFLYNQGDWPTIVPQILAQNSPVNVGIQAHADATNTLIVDVEIYYTGSQTVSSNKLNVAVVQNNVVEDPMVQAGGSSNSFYYDASTGTYTHQHMLRHLMTGQWGEQIDIISAGTFVQKQYTWTLPLDINGTPLDPTNLEIIAFISESSTEILSGNSKLVSTAGWVAPSWDCTGGACIDPGTGNGLYSSATQCIDNCNITPTWNCKGGADGVAGQGECSDPGDGTGNHTDSLLCEQTCIKRSYVCTPGVSCVDPGDESGTFPTLVGCQFSCGVSESWECNADGYCEDPGDGSGTYSNVNNCIQSGCLPPADIHNIDFINVSIFPNPVSDILTINGEYSEVNIYDLFGKLVFSSTPKKTLNISNLNNGIYIVRINNKKAISINKIIISH